MPSIRWFGICVVREVWILAPKLFCRYRQYSTSPDGSLELQMARRTGEADIFQTGKDGKC
jgi:hypothetical protein